MATPTSSRTLTETVTSTISSTTETCTTAVPGRYGHVPYDACNSNYNFYPNFGVNLAFAVLIGVSTLVHLIQTIVYKKAYHWVLLMGCTWECAAFVLRTIGAHNQQVSTYASLGFILILLAPLWVNAFLYMTVARLVYFILPDHQVFRVKATTLTKIFVWLDVIAFMIQITGGVLLEASDETPELLRPGQQTYMSGIGVQLAFIIIFGVFTGRLYLRMQRDGRSDRPVRMAKRLVWAMYLVFGLIIIRIIFRFVEFAPGIGEDNKIIRNENYTFGLDALPVFLGLVVLNVVNPGMVLRGPESDFPKLSRKERKAIK